MYDPETGRFIQRDPFAGFAGRPGTLNRYVYVGHNPVNSRDPSGLDEFALGLTGSVGGVGNYFSGSVLLTAVTNGDVGIQITGAYGGTTAVVTGGLGVTGEWSPNATSIQDVGGVATFGGSSVALRNAAGLDVSYSPTATQFDVTIGFGATLSPPAGVPAPIVEFHGGESYTWTPLSGNVINLLTGNPDLPDTTAAPETETAPDPTVSNPAPAPGDDTPPADDDPGTPVDPATTGGVY